MKNRVKNIQAGAYNGARMIKHLPIYNLSKMQPTPAPTLCAGDNFSIFDFPISLISYFFTLFFSSASADCQPLRAGPILGSLLPKTLPFTESRSGLSFVITENPANKVGCQPKDYK